MTVAAKIQNRSRRWLQRCRQRRGIIAVLSAFILVGVFAFCALAIDVGRMMSAQTRMQNAVDAAALAASQEITKLIWNSADTGGAINYDQAVASARAMAEDVAERNGVYIDPQRDVRFGRRYYDWQTGTWPIAWGTTPYNVVKVTARRDNQDPTAPDAKYPLTFGWAIGRSSVEMYASATAFVQARDFVVVLDFSSSMNDDSQLDSSLPLAAVEANLDDMWDTLVFASPTWPGTSRSKFPASGFGGINSYRGVYLSSNDTNTVFNQLGLGQLDASGKPLYPYPQSGKTGDNYNPMPSAAQSAALWKNYISYTQSLSGPYRKRYGYRTLLHYMLKQKYRNRDSEDLWRTPHYPFHANKEGLTLFCDFLKDLGFGDEVGLVTYDTTARVELALNEVDATVDISDDPITADLDAIDTIQRHKQAGHYNNTTGLGYGIREATQLLDGYHRCGARATMLVMTDGRANQYPRGWSLPGDWDWAELTDFDGDGSPDYTTSNPAKQYAFYEAREAIRKGYTIHTMTVGANADDDLMEAMAKASGGVWIDVPGGNTVQDMEDQILDAFARIAAAVPPAQLIDEEAAEAGYADDVQGVCGVVDTDNGDTGNDNGNNDSGNSGNGNAGNNNQGGNNNSGNGSGKDNSGKNSDNKSGKDKSGKDKSGKDKSGKDKSGKDKSGKDKSGKDKSGKDKSGKDKSGKDKSGKDKSGKDKSAKDNSGKDKSGAHGNNGVGNGVDPQPPGNPPVNDGPGTGPGNPGNKGGAH